MNADGLVSQCWMKIQWQVKSLVPPVKYAKFFLAGPI
jgi:hypothetical protein